MSSPATTAVLRLAEVEHPAVAQPADGPASPAAGDVVHQRGQPPGDLGGDLVAAFLGQLGVAGQVDEADRRGLRHPLLQSRSLERLLDVVDGVLGPDMLAMAPVDHHDGPLEQPDDAVAEPRAELDQPALVQAGGAEAAARCWSRSTRPRPWRSGAGCRRTRPAAAGWRRRRTPAPRNSSAMSSMVMSSSPARAAGSGGAKPSAWWTACRNSTETPALGGELPVGTVQALGRRHHRRVQEGQGQRSPVDQLHDRLDREPGLRPGVQQPGAPDLPGAQPRLLGGQGPERDQVPYKALGDVGPLGDLPDVVRHLPVSSRPVGVAAGRIVDQPDIACSSCAAGSWVARCRHPPGTAAPDERPGCLGWDVTRARPGGRKHATRHSTRPTDTRGVVPDRPVRAA